MVPRQIKQETDLMQYYETFTTIVLKAIQAGGMFLNGF